MPMKYVFSLVVIALAAVLFPCRHAQALPFQVPETLTYELAWEGIYAGTSTLSISRERDGYKIVSAAKSANYISLFYKVRDQIESITRGNSFASASYDINSHEGWHVKHLGVLFADGHGRQKTAYIDYLARPGSKPKEFRTPPGIMDPLSGFFYVRTMPLVVGRPVHVTIFDDEKVWNVKVRVLKKERVHTWAGTFNTVKIEPLLKSGGIFRRSGAIYIWVTDDARHIPVMLASKVKVGYIKAVLEKAQY